MSGADRVRAMGLVCWVINLGYAIGLTIGGALASVSFRWLFVGDGLTTIAFGLLVAAGVPRVAPAAAARAAREEAGALEGVRRAVPRPAVRRVPAAQLPDRGGVHAERFDVPARHVGARPHEGRGRHGARAQRTASSCSCSRSFRPCSRRNNRSRVLAVGTFTIGLGFGLHMFASGPLAFAAAVAVWTMGEMAVLPVANALTADLRRRPARTPRMARTCRSAPRCAAPVAGTWMLQTLAAPGSGRPASRPARSCGGHLWLSRAHAAAQGRRGALTGRKRRARRHLPAAAPRGRSPDGRRRPAGVILKTWAPVRGVPSRRTSRAGRTRRRGRPACSLTGPSSRMDRTMWPYRFGWPVFPHRCSRNTLVALALRARTRMRVPVADRT